MAYFCPFLRTKMAYIGHFSKNKMAEILKTKNTEHKIKLLVLIKIKNKVCRLLGISQKSICVKNFPFVPNKIIV